MALKYLEDNGFADILGLSPAVSPANPYYSKSVTVSGCKLKYSVEVDTNSALDYDITTGTGSWGLYSKLKSDVTTLPGVSVTLSKNFGKLGKAAQEYLTDHGFGTVSMGAGSVSYDTDTNQITLEGFKVADVNKFNFAPYADRYTTTQTISLSKTIDLDATLKAAVVFLIVLSFIFMWEVYGAAALGEALLALGSSGVAALTSVL